jgi:GTP-binding protein
VNVEATFVRSAAAADDFPRDGLAEVVLVGRSNVGKSSLVNALARRRVARTSAAPGKTRLANVYRVARGGEPPFYLIDLPGYGYARGGSGDFERLVRDCFARARARAPAAPRTPNSKASGSIRARGEPRASATQGRSAVAAGTASGGQPSRPHHAPGTNVGALLLVDARHPGLESDLEAWRWLRGTVELAAIVATKIDKLARGERLRAVQACESVFGHAVLPVSAATGEGLDQLWKLIDKMRCR